MCKPLEKHPVKYHYNELDGDLRSVLDGKVKWKNRETESKVRFSRLGNKQEWVLNNKYQEINLCVGDFLHRNWQQVWT